MPDIKEPNSDLYEIMDEAGLTTSDLFNTKESMPKIINGIRTRLVTKLAKYITEREQKLIRKGNDDNS